MIPVSWYHLARAAPGRILVKRDNPPEKSGLIILSDHWRQKTKTSFGLVVDIDPKLQGLPYWIGAYVLLNPSVGRRILFGYSSLEENDYQLESYPPNAVKIVFLETPEHVQSLGESFLRNERLVNAREPEVYAEHVDGESEALR